MDNKSHRNDQPRTSEPLIIELSERVVNDLVDYELADSTTNILNLVPMTARIPILNCIEQAPDLFGLDEFDLLKKLKYLKASPNANDNRLRLAFWMEYDRIKAGDLGGKQMKMSAVYNGICTGQYLTQRYLLCPERVAWMLCPPASYDVFMEEALVFGMAQLREVLELPLIDEKGKVNVGLASLKERIVMKLHERKYGAVIQKSLNVNLNSEDGMKIDKKLQEQIASCSMEDIQRRFKELSKRDRLAPKDLDAKEAEVVHSAK